VVQWIASHPAQSWRSQYVSGIVFLRIRGWSPCTARRSVILYNTTAGIRESFCLGGHSICGHVAGYTIEDAVDPDGVALFICNLRDPSDLFSVEVNAGCIDAADRNDEALEGHGPLGEVPDHAQAVLRRFIWLPNGRDYAIVTLWNVYTQRL
jgi:hypothetical protein